MNSYFKREPYRNKKILKAARGESCALQFPEICTGGGEDTVFAHSPYLEDGKGTGQKSDDFLGCFACRACHDELDGRTSKSDQMPGWLKRDYFHAAMKRTWRRLIELNVIG